MERDETKLGAAPSTLGTAKAALLLLVGEFLCSSWGVGGEKGGAGCPSCLKSDFILAFLLQEELSP